MPTSELWCLRDEHNEYAVLISLLDCDHQSQEENLRRKYETIKQPPPTLIT